MRSRPQRSEAVTDSAGSEELLVGRPGGGALTRLARHRKRYTGARLAELQLGSGPGRVEIIREN
jgi:hypothetical protein